MVLLKTIIFTLVAPGSVAVFFPYLISNFMGDRFTVELGGFRFAGLLLSLPGVLMYLRCAWGFTFVGRGTPAPMDPPKELVAEGLYRFVRNPMYVAVLLIISGEAIWFGSIALLAYEAAIFLMFHLFITVYEEPTLEKKFGESYVRYRASVPRWIPKTRA